MKFFCLIIFAVASGASALAQTNSMLAMPRGPTQIHSDSADFDMAASEAIYRGHVRVNDPQMKLTCAFLTATLSVAEGRVNHIVAETNVVIDFTDEKGQTSHATCDKAIYDYNVQNGVTNETVTLTGNPQPKLQDAQGTQVADAIVWDRANDSFHFYGNYRMNFRQNFNGATTNTNFPLSKTNLPPGTIENIDRMIIPQGQSF